MRTARRAVEPALEGGDIISDVPVDAAECSCSLPFFEQLQREQNGFVNVAAFAPAELSVNSEGRTSRVRGLFVSGEFFSTLGVNQESAEFFGNSVDQKQG